MTTRPFIWLFNAVLAVIVLICALFTFVASWTLFVVLWQGGGPGLLLLKLGIKGAFFGLAALSSVYVLTKLARKMPLGQSEPAVRLEERLSARSVGVLVGVLCVAALLVFPRLDEYPRPEPDETHHLVVARNLAEYGLYASGHPDAGFNILDDYDSVGPVVILPVAAALKTSGTNIIHARTVMGVFFLALCMAVFFFSLRLFGLGPSALGTLMIVAAWGSVYLARSLYGEVPALFCLIVGLCVWRRALSAQSYGLGVLAGLLFGMSVLCKSFMINSAWAFLGAFVYDRITYRRIGFRHVVAPALGAVVVMAAWWLVQKAYQQGDVDIAADTLHVYQQYLMFGIRSVPPPLMWLLRQPVTLLMSILAFGFVAPIIFHKRYDPPAVVLFLYAPFMTYWWLFFTTGSHPRYTWYTCALAGIFTGVLAWHVLLRLRQTTPRLFKVGALVVLALIAVPPCYRVFVQTELVFATDEMGDERALAAYVRSLPADTTIGTTVWPLERSLNFLSGRNVNRVKRFEQDGNNFDIVIVAPNLYDTPQGLENPSRTFGKYAVFERNRR